MILLFILISVLVFLPASVILFLFYQHLRSQYLFNKYNTPTPIGETPKFPLGNYDFSKEDHEWQLAWAKKFGSVLRGTQFGIPVYVTGDARDAKYVLSQVNLPKTILMNEIAVVWGKTGIITTHHHGANPWKIYRKFIDPAFKLTALRALQSIFDQHSREFVLYLQSLGDNAVIEMESELKKLTLSIIADVIGCGKEAVDPGFLDSLNVIITALNSPLIFLPLGTHLWIYLHRKDYDAVINNINRVIRERRIKNESQKEVRVRDMLDILLSEDFSGRVLTDDEARDQLIQIFIAGTDTTANTLAWFFYIISNNMEYQRRLIEEVDTLADFTQETLDKSMPYTFQLFQETMRVYPPVLYLARETGDTAVELPSGVTVPPNVMVQVGPLVLHRNPEYWSDPDKFDPERWAEGGEAFTEKCKHAFIPFSAGPRQCAGKLFFYKEAKTIVSHIFSSFEFLPHEHKDNGVMSSKAGLMKPRAVWVKLKRRG